MYTDDPSRQRLTLTNIVQASANARWRTEAMRAHANPRLIFVTRGQGRITVAGLTSGYGPNNLIYLPPGTMYGYEAGATVHGVILAIPDALGEDWPDEPVQLRLRDVASQKEVSGHIDIIERELTAARTTETEGDEFAARRHLRTAHHYLGILALTFERVVETRGPESGDARAAALPARIAAAYTDLVERDFRTTKGVSDFARDLGITPTHLTRCCKESCGKSALAILNDRILYEARLLLRGSRTPVGRIATSLGFGSAAYFTRSFQSATGQTPTAFRRESTPQTA